MNVTTRACVLGCAFAGGVSALPGLAGAQAQAAAKSYLVTMSVESASGRMVVHEGLSLERAGNAARLQIAAADGSVLSRPVTFTSQGEIASSAPDGAVTCYNMAMNVLARERDPGGDPAVVFVRFGNSIVRVPLTMRTVQTHGGERDVALDGRSSGIYSSADANLDAGIIINAAVAEAAGELRGATFAEIRYLGAPAHVVGRSTCELQRAEAPLAPV